MKKKLVITLTIIALTSAAALGFLMPKIINTNNSTAIETSVLSSTQLHDIKIKDPITVDDTKTTINLGDTITVEGETSGVIISNNTVTINSSGTYNITGTLIDGQIIINSSDKESIKILLNGVNITSSTSAAINILDGDTIFTLAENTENYISDAPNYNFEDDTKDEPDAAIFSKDDLTFNGTGSLNINGNHKSAIKSKNDLIILNGNYEINSVDDAIKGKDSVIIVNGTFNITTSGDAISSTNTEEDTGYVEIHNGSFNISADKDGIQAQSNLIIADGTFNITTGRGSENSQKISQAIPEFKNGNIEAGNFPQMPAASPDGAQVSEASPNNIEIHKDMPRENNNMQKPNMNFNKENTTTSTTEDAVKDSKKALKSSSTLLIEGGTFNINSSDDSIHSNGDVIINNGNFSIQSGDKGIHADINLEINNGTLKIDKSYEGLEASYITINNGNLDITSNDDGLNASDNSGNDTFTGPGQSSDSKISITINGGCVTVNSTADGLDSNGSIYINGGTTIINGPVSNGDGALDSDGTIKVNGGILIAAGSSGMAEVPDSSSTQKVLNLALSSKEAGSVISIVSESGENIISFAPKKQYSSLIISTPSLKENTSYKILSGDLTTESSTNGLYSSSNGGNEIGTITTSENINTFTESGASNSFNAPKGGQGDRGGKFNSSSNETKTPLGNA